MKHRFEAPVLSSLVFLATTVVMHATPLVPGGTVAPTPGAAPAGTPLLLDPVSQTEGGLNEAFSWKTSSGTHVGTNAASGNFLNAVYRDPSTGTLDFYYQIQNTFNGPANGQNTLINAFHLTNWANIVITSVQQLSKPTPGAFFGDGGNVEFENTVDPITTVTRTGGAGNDISINFLNTLAPGQNSSVLLLKTTSVDFDLGSGTFAWVTAPTPCSVPPSPGNLTPCGVADFQVFGLGALEPIVPEPGFYGMLALGMACLWMGVHRRSAKAKA